ncbi:hypothetical protein AB0J38_11670 [Streptomyces sp. NPDC050095]|uniref:hypothetical protein n=1 Tax=unclassified Streptomyces TaxID=2593676 RepID=UPI00343AEE04
MPFGGRQFQQGQPSGQIIVVGLSVLFGVGEGEKVRGGLVDDTPEGARAGHHLTRVVQLDDAPGQQTVKVRQGVGVGDRAGVRFGQQTLGGITAEEGHGSTPPV